MNGGRRDCVPTVSRGWRVGLAVTTLCVAVACVQDSGEPGPLGGPSELGLSLSLTATPDQLPLDGAARSVIEIVARDQHGTAVADVVLALQIVTARGFEDFGRLSARQVATGSDGRARATYKAPLSAASGPAVDTGEVVTISVTPIDRDFSNEVSRELTIRLVPPGTIIPPFSAVPGFALAPETPTVFNSVLFTTACSTATSADCVRDPAGIVTAYKWDFGDGRSGVGPTSSHTYLLAGTYLATLTIRDANGRSAEVTRAVIVGGGTPPTAVLSVSPTDPKEQDTVFFNASGSTAVPGRTIASHAWDFGDGSTGSGVTTSHAYHTTGTYTVTLKVTDDRGQIGTATASVVVGVTGPTAGFVFSPTKPDDGDTVFFDAIASVPGPGRTIVSYRWNFGDGGASTAGPKTTHKYANDGTFEVQLQVTNDVAETDTTSQSVTVDP